MTALLVAAGIFGASWLIAVVTLAVAVTCAPMGEADLSRLDRLDGAR